MFHLWLSLLKEAATDETQISTDQEGIASHGIPASRHIKGDHWGRVRGAQCSGLWIFGEGISGALKVELENQGYTAQEEVPICVFYKEVEVGFYKPESSS